MSESLEDAFSLRSWRWKSKEKIAEAIFDSPGAFTTALEAHEPAFILTSGRLSPYYIDLRVLPSFPENFRKILTQLIWVSDTLIGEEDFDKIASTESAGIPWGSRVAAYFEKPFIYVRKKAKAYGRGKKIEGVLRANEKVLLIDDLTTTLGTARNAVEAIREKDSEVIAYIPIFDRKQYSTEEKAKLGVPILSLISIGEFVDLLREKNKITLKEYEQIKDYHYNEARYALQVLSENRSEFLRKFGTELPRIIEGYKRLGEEERFREDPKRAKELSDLLEELEKLQKHS